MSDGGCFVQGVIQAQQCHSWRFKRGLHLALLIYRCGRGSTIVPTHLAGTHSGCLVHSVMQSARACLLDVRREYEDAGDRVYCGGTKPIALSVQHPIIVVSINVLKKMTQ